MLTLELEAGPEPARALWTAVWQEKGEELCECLFLAEDHVAFWIPWPFTPQQGDGIAAA